MAHCHGTAARGQLGLGRKVNVSPSTGAEVSIAVSSLLLKKSTSVKRVATRWHFSQSRENMAACREPSLSSWSSAAERISRNIVDGIRAKL